MKLLEMETTISGKKKTLKSLDWKSTEEVISKLKTIQNKAQREEELKDYEQGTSDLWENTRSPAYLPVQDRKGGGLKNI